MKRVKKMLVTGIMLLVVGVFCASAFAESAYKSPVEALAGITERTVESILAERKETGKTFGAIAKEAGKLDEYTAECLEIRKDYLLAQVSAGKLTQEEADAILSKIEAKQIVCDGTGAGCLYDGGTGYGCYALGGAGCANSGMGGQRASGGGCGRGAGMGRRGGCY